MALGKEVDVAPGHIVLDGDPAPLRKGAQPPSFRPMSIVTKRSPISATAELVFVLCCRTVVCLSCLSVTLVYCGQTVGWIKMPLGMEVGLSHI